MNYKVLGVSAGGGVSLYPFKKHLTMNIESRSIFHTPDEIQWKANFGDIPFTHGKNLVCDGYPDVIISSPDCGSGSILRMSRAKKYGNHKENYSLTIFFAAITMGKPKFFLFENLEGLFRSYSLEDFQKMVPNYRLIIHNASVAFWGNSQIHRKRLIIVGIRKDLSPKIDKYFKLPDYRHKNKTCRELYGDLDDIWADLRLGHVREDPKELCTIHAGRKLKILEIMKWWLENPNAKRWKVEGKKFTTAPGVYRNRLKDYPATARKANRQFDHNGYMLTPRQLARIQGIPDEFILYISRDKLNYWINKGRALVTKTPPYEISVWFKKKLEKTYKIWKDSN
jgi:site-specific DNA-cytosine methylase